MDVTPEKADQPIPLSRALEIRKEKEEKLVNCSEQVLRDILEEVVTSRVLDKVSRLENSINRVLEHIESVRAGEAEDAALRVTTDKAASDIALAHINLNSDDYYQYTTSEIASRLNIRLYDAQQIIKKSGIKNQPVFHQEIKLGKTSSFHKYSDEALDFLKKFLEEEQYIIPEHRKL